MLFMFQGVFQLLVACFHTVIQESDELFLDLFYLYDYIPRQHLTCQPE